MIRVKRVTSLSRGQLGGHAPCRVPCEGYEGEKLRPTSYSKLTTTYLEEDPSLLKLNLLGGFIACGSKTFSGTRK